MLHYLGNTGYDKFVKTTKRREQNSKFLKAKVKSVQNRKMKNSSAIENVNT
jgi:hypothetical protein